MSTDIILRSPQEIIRRRSAEIILSQPKDKEKVSKRRRAIHLLAILLPSILFGYVILGYLSFILGRR